MHSWCESKSWCPPKKTEIDAENGSEPLNLIDIEPIDAAEAKSKQASKGRRASQMAKAEDSNPTEHR